jgi:hypothetical protein
MSIETAIIIVLAFAAGWYIGSTVTTHLLALSFRQILTDLGVKNSQLRQLATDVGVELPAVNQNAADGDSLTPLEVTLEHDQGVIYAYRKDTKQFLAQGTDADSLIARLNENLTPCKVVVAKEDGADLLQKSHT